MIPSLLHGARVGLALSARRLLRRRALAALGLGAALVLTSALIEVSVTSAAAVDRALTATFRLVIPLVTFALAAEASDRDHLRDAAWPAARFGLGRGAVALGLTAASLLATAAAGALLAVIAVIAAHTPAAPPLARDALTSAWIGALAGAAYGGWYALGGTFLRRGQGRLAPLLADLFLGGSTGLLGALLPRGNALNLIGGPAPLHLAQPSSAWILAATALALALAAALRARD